MADEIDWECENCGRLMGTSDSRPGLQVCDNCNFTRPLPDTVLVLNEDAIEELKAQSEELEKEADSFMDWLKGRGVDLDGR